MKENDRPNGNTETAANVAGAISERLMALISELPSSNEPQAKNPDGRSRELISEAALRSAAISGTLSLPPGPVGLVTVLPDVFAIWRVQTRLVADIASTYGKSASLTPEATLYCLFKHTAAQAVRGLAVKVGGRILIRQTSLLGVQKILRTVGIRLSQRALSRAVSRWLPVVGAVGVAAYAYLDTCKVGQTASELFSQAIVDQRQTC